MANPAAAGNNDAGDNSGSGTTAPSGMHWLDIRLVNHKIVMETSEDQRLRLADMEVEERQRSAKLALDAVDDAWEHTGAPQWSVPVVQLFRTWICQEVIDAYATNQAMEAVRKGYLAREEPVEPLSEHQYRVVMWTRVLQNRLEPWCKSVHMA